MASLLLSGCQHAAKSAPDAATQRDQLSSLVGAGQFLRDRCNRADIPAGDKLAAAALQEAKEKIGRRRSIAPNCLRRVNTSPRGWRPTPRRCRKSAVDSTARWRLFSPAALAPIGSASHGQATAPAPAVASPGPKGRGWATSPPRHARSNSHSRLPAEANSRIDGKRHSRWHSAANSLIAVSQPLAAGRQTKSQYNSQSAR
ncbi:hypothetical protein M8494_20530 [Serratia ureilytica]